MGLLSQSRHKFANSLKRKMFSGIIEEIGLCAKLEIVKNMILWDGSISEGTQLTVQLKENSAILNDSYIGCSISVNGVCLTATAINIPNGSFSAGLAPETLRRSNLGFLKPGSDVNLERALRADGRNSGHFVQGHVGIYIFKFDVFTKMVALMISIHQYN